MELKNYALATSVLAVTLAPLSTASAQSSPAQEQCAPHELLRTLKSRYGEDIDNFRKSIDNLDYMAFQEDIPGGLVIELIIERSGTEKFFLRRAITPSKSVVGYEYTLESDPDCMGYPSEVYDVRREYDYDLKEKHSNPRERFKKVYIDSLAIRANRALEHLKKNDRQIN